MTLARRDLSHAPEHDHNHDKYKKYANGLQNFRIYQANVTPDIFWNLKVGRQNPAHRISKAHVAVASHWIMGRRACPARLDRKRSPCELSQPPKTTRRPWGRRLHAHAWGESSEYARKWLRRR
jgi:hypothetical protein